MNSAHHSSLALLSVAVGLSLILGSAARCHAESDGDWKIVKGKHFVVYHFGTDQFAEEVCHAAEGHYERIARDLDYTKHDNFWLWKDRIGIYIYRTRDQFVHATSAPEWAAARATYRRKEIVTFLADENLLESVLPHEIAHLVFRDLVGFEGEVPSWLNEGFAQWEETGKRDNSLLLARQLQQQNRLMGLKDLTQSNVTTVNDVGKAAEFYAEAATLVGYLIETYGSEKLRKLCGQLRDGKSLDNALRFTYPDTMRNITDLETAWKDYLARRK